MRLTTRLCLCTLMFLAANAQAIMPLTVETCRAMKIEAQRQECLRAAVDAPPSVTGKTYSTNDVPRRGPAVIDQSAPPVPIAPIVPYVNMTPGSRPANAR
ncbi:hypothetical protein GT347_02730 [Xylophilus rhododendri]|uniref:Uncharacterized protein n=1 Tax=Xylophilus rhododendri TaxID=2697032 RepID=A0A857J293_9BURK|nr:hypothetical protein [Xylophilus rhododendri]QHI96995.1 hypothetical protein GT347_02730 [Xylophilus rhododendri]